MIDEVDLLRRLNIIEQQLDGLTKPEMGRWVDWTPTLTQSSSVAHTLIYARYIIDETKKVTLVVRLDVTGVGSVGNDIVIGGIPAIIDLGVSPAALGGTGLVTNGSTNRVGAVVVSSTPEITFFADGFTGAIGTTPSFALANGDLIEFFATYERA